MLRVLVNASAAKESGALTILNSFCSEKVNDTTAFYIIMSPVKPLQMPVNSQWIKCYTRGLFTILYACFFVNYYYFKYKCDKTISFSNVGSFLYNTNGFIYFHNFLILSNNDIKYKLIRFAIKFLQNNSNTIIVQTDFVKESFERVFGYKYKVLVKWPGIDDRQLLKVKKSSNNKNISNKFKILIPITNVNLPHKNFDLIYDVAKNLSYESNIQFFVTSYSPKDESKYSYIENVKYIGPLSSDIYLNFMMESDVVLISSFFETVSLPIFEAAFLNKKIFVYKVDYICFLNEKYNLNTLFLYDDTLQLIELILSGYKEKTQGSQNEIQNELNFIKGLWDF